MYGEQREENRFLTDIGFVVDCLLFDLDVLPPVGCFLDDIVINNFNVLYFANHFLTSCFFYFLYSLTPTNLALYHSYLNFLYTLLALNSFEITVAFSLFATL